MRSERTARIAAALVTLALVSAGCSDSEEVEPPDSNASAAEDTGSGDSDGEEAQTVEVTAECSRGETLSSAPVDTSGISFLEDAAEETPWVRRDVTVGNGSDVAARAEPDLLVRYLDETGTPITEAELGEPYPPALLAAAGQTVSRATISFGVDGGSGLVEDPAMSEALLSSVESCELVGNSEIVGGAESDTVPAGGDATLTGFAAAFTIQDVDAATDCALLAAIIT